MNWGRLKALLHHTTHNTTNNKGKGGPPAATTVGIPLIKGITNGPTAIIDQ